MSEVIGCDLVVADYSTRQRLLLEHGIGLWDVVGEASREGSLDSKIRMHAKNDLVSLTASLPELAAIAFNDGTAARIGLKVLGLHAGQYQIIKLPSSSPAYTLTYADKSCAWGQLRTWTRFSGFRVVLD